MSFVPSNRKYASRQVEIKALLIDENEMAYCLLSSGTKAWVRKSVTRQITHDTWTMPETVAKSKQFIWT
jgi:hypothetical protein